MGIVLYTSVRKLLKGESRNSSAKKMFKEEYKHVFIQPCKVAHYISLSLASYDEVSKEKEHLHQCMFYTANLRP